MSPTTKIDTIADSFRQRVVDGEYGISGRLPSLRMLAEEYGTTHETMNKVVQLLQADGVLLSKGRAGVFVSKPRTRIPGITARFDAYLEERGLAPVEINIDAPALVPAPAEVAKAFAIPIGSDVVRRIRKQGTKTEHYRITESFYPVSLAGGSILEQMQQDVRLDVLLEIKKASGKIIEAVHEEVVARLPTSQEQALLGIVRNTPILEVHRSNYTKDRKTVVMFSRIIFVAKFFVLEYDYATPLWSNK